MTFPHTPDDEAALARLLFESEPTDCFVWDYELTDKPGVKLTMIGHGSQEEMLYALKNIFGCARVVSVTPREVS